jgi:hypothetical protein
MLYWDWSRCKCVFSTGYWALLAKGPGLLHPDAHTRLRKSMGSVYICWLN